MAALKVATFCCPTLKCMEISFTCVLFALAVGPAQLVYQAGHGLPFPSPLIILTIGFFYFVINAVIIYCATKIVPAFLPLTVSDSCLQHHRRRVHWLLTVILPG